LAGPALVRSPRARAARPGVPRLPGLTVCGAGYTENAVLIQL